MNGHRSAHSGLGSSTRMADVAARNADHSASLGTTVGSSNPVYPAISGERVTVCADLSSLPIVTPQQTWSCDRIPAVCLVVRRPGPYTRVAHVGILLNASNPSVMWGAREGYSPTVTW